MEQNEKWLQWAVELQSLAQAGLYYGKDPFDRERYERIREISAEMVSCKSGLSMEKVEDLFCRTACGVALPRRKSGRGWVLDLTGRRFGRLVVISRDKGRHSHRGEAHWLCRCDCGGLSVVRSDHLRSGHTASCGCRAVGPDGKEIKPGQAM